MPTRTTQTGAELFIVDNSDPKGTALRYLRDWSEFASSLDIAYFEIGSLLAMEDDWKQIDQLRILMGDEVSKRTRQAFEDRYLLGILNSNAVNDFYAEISSHVRGGYLRFIYQYIAQIPIPKTNRKNRETIERLVNKCLAAEGENCNEHEREINHRVAKLYGLEDWS